MSIVPGKTHPGYLQLPVEKLPANRVVPIEMYIYMPVNGKMLLYKEETAVLGPVKHARMHEFKDRFFYKKEDQPKLDSFLKSVTDGEAKPTLTLVSNSHFLAGATTREELQRRSADLLFNHFNFSFDPDRPESMVEQMQSQINQVTADVLDVLEVDAGILDKLKAYLASIDVSEWNHASNVACITALLGLSIGYTDKELLRDLAMGGYLHDIGLATCGLRAASRELDYTAEELERFEKHPAAGLELLEILDLPISENVKIIVYQHEEKYDGSGFPSKAAGPDIFEPAQIVAIATRIDHLICSVEPGALSVEDALRKIGEDNGTPGHSVDFNPTLLNQIFDALSKQNTLSAA